MDLTIVLEVVGIIGGVATWLALSLGPMIYLGSKIDAIRKDLSDFKTDMHQESKDFHARLCVIEEKRIKVLEK